MTDWYHTIFYFFNTASFYFFCVLNFSVKIIFYLDNNELSIKMKSKVSKYKEVLNKK